MFLEELLSISMVKIFLSKIAQYSQQGRIQDFLFSGGVHNRLLRLTCDQRNARNLKGSSKSIRRR